MDIRPVMSNDQLPATTPGLIQAVDDFFNNATDAEIEEVLKKSNFDYYNQFGKNIIDPQTYIITALQGGPKIGDKVEKTSGKPFKSQLKINTVKGYTINKHTGKVSLTFVEDGSDVEAFRCRVVK